jgi:hypothetical protein
MDKYHLQQNTAEWIDICTPVSQQSPLFILAMLSPVLAISFLASSVLASLIDVEERDLATSPRCGQWE